MVESGIASDLKRVARALVDRVPPLARARRRIDELSAELAERRALEYVPAGHFYSPFPSREDLAARRAEVFDRDPLVVPGVDLRVAEQVSLLGELLPFLEDMPFEDDPVGGLRFGFDNPTYSYGDGTFLHLVLRWLRPRRIIEVGSGHSSACTLDTVELFLDGATECTFIEPYDELLRSLLKPDDPDRIEILASPVQDVGPELFGALGADDLLFIDSTHVSKAGSDVNHLLFEVLPALSPGVVVHLHDVFPGFEYPWDWVMEGRAWTEDYLLRAFLQFNTTFQIVLWPSLLARTDPSLASRVPQLERNPGASIYLRKVR